MTALVHFACQSLGSHYAVLVFIGVMALFPMYFMAVSGLRNGIQLQTNPSLCRSLNRSVPSTAKPGAT